MTKLNIQKVLDELPSVITPSTIYFVKEGDRVVQYVSDSDGNTAHPVVQKEEPLHPLFNF